MRSSNDCNWTLLIYKVKRYKMPSPYVTFWHAGAALLPVPHVLTGRWGGSQTQGRNNPLPCPCNFTESFPGISLRAIWIVQCGRFCTAASETSSTANMSHCKKCNSKLEHSFRFLSFLFSSLRPSVVMTEGIGQQIRKKNHQLLSLSNCTSRRTLIKMLNVSLKVVSKKLWFV